MVVTGNEDGAHDAAATTLFNLSHLGCAIPPNADTYWVGDAGPGPSFIEADGWSSAYTQKTCRWMAHNTVHLRADPEGEPDPGRGQHGAGLGAGMTTTGRPVWHRVLGPDDLPEGRVTTVTAGHRSLAMTHHEGRYGALDNRCPHQGGPLGEGAIENGWLRCPWHGWDYCPITGKAPGGHEDSGVATFPVDVRDDGVWVEVPPEPPHVRTVTDLMVETMVAWGVTHVFGMVGHSNLGLADAVRRQVEAGDADLHRDPPRGRGELRRLGVRQAHRPPGGLPVDRRPGRDQPADRALGREGRPRADPRPDRPGRPPGARPGRLPGGRPARGLRRRRRLGPDRPPREPPRELMALALKHAIVGRDVSHLVFPDGVQTRPAREGARARPGGARGGAGHRPARRRAGAGRRAPAGGAPAGDHRRPRRPLHMDAVLRAGRAPECPGAHHLQGQGLVSDHHPLGCGVLGRSGTPIASWFMNEADLLLVMGASFSNHTGITPKIPTSRSTPTRWRSAASTPSRCRVQGDLAVTAGLLLDALEGAEPPEDRRPEIARRWASGGPRRPGREADDRGRGLSAASLFAAMSRLVPEDAVIAVDVGNNTYSFGRYFECARQSVLMSGYLGSIGFGYPAAMGAWCAAPDRPIVCVTGDGGFGQYLGELTTAVKYGMPITHVLLNNGQLGKISKEQRAGSGTSGQTDLHNPGFAAYAELCGALGIRVERREELEPALARALAHDGPTLVEVIQDPELV